MTLEGSAFCCDGEGTAIALSTTALDSQRNHRISKLDAYGILSHWLGVNRVIWLDKGLGKNLGASELRQICAFVTPAHAVVGEQKTSLGVTFWNPLLSAFLGQKTRMAGGSKLTAFPFLMLTEKLRPTRPFMQ
jgi:hypothetical protein